jgi:hypothetical protein
VRAQVLLGNEPGCLADDSPQRSGIELGVRGHRESLGPLGDDPLKLDVATPLRDYGESEALQDGDDLARRRVYAGRA